MPNDLPFLKFFVSDWLSDEKLRLCSIGARGLWVDMLCLMAKAERRGYLELSRGVALPPEMLARMVGIPVDELLPLATELEKCGVFSREQQTGVVYSRRMVRDESKRSKCSEAGKHGGGNPTFKGHPKGAPKGRPKGPPNPQSLEAETEAEAELELTPPTGGKRKDRCALEEAEEFAESIGLPRSDGTAIYWKWVGNGWVNNKQPIKDWRAVIRQWKASGYHVSQKNQNGRTQKPTTESRANAGTANAGQARKY